MDQSITKSDKRFYPPALTIVFTVGLFFAAQFIASFIFVFIALGAGWDDARLEQWIKESSFPQLLYILVADALIITGVWQLLKRKNLRFKDVGFAKPRLSDGGKALIAYAIYIVLFVIISVVAKLVAPSLNLEQEQQIGFEASKSVVNIVLAGVGLVILPPIVEEILTRGFLYTGLRKYMKIVPAAIITSLVFAAAHLQFGNGAPLLWVAAIDTFVLSLVLVYLRETTGRLAAPMFLHGLKNAIAFSLLFIFV